MISSELQLLIVYSSFSVYLSQVYLISTSLFSECQKNAAAAAMFTLLASLAFVTF